MQIDLETGEILEDGSEEELAAWIQLYRATPGHETPSEPPGRALPLLGAGCTPTAGPHRWVWSFAERAQRGEKHPPP